MSEFGRSVGSRRFVVFCSEVFAAQADGLLDVVERLSAQGEAFKDGEVFNFGGVPFSIWERGDQVVIGPPVAAGMAELGEGDDVSPFFALLMAQLEFASRFGVEP
ncbi:hypothetical protein HRD49_40875 [Corallococcus exiguus]|uniref:hypothetical protein n=1 Tax=Corallococcus TaxID=83461 RepID=UPI000F889537|nr:MULTISPECIES: hypothetical protein [Corallococcus]NNC22205.1 hypothetical protein [Corallococcus exiguus]NRD59227.1 hypothetical protein [Corallococcus exiguus]NRD68102.1 hypothetical protein [Corallococcus exiguus]RUO87404.1 hypothetical protein D7Y11_40870 [Corallococcus sp. AB018]